MGCLILQEAGSQGEPTGSLQRRLNRQSLLGRNPSLSRQQVDTYATRVMALDEAGESYAQKIHRLFMEAGGLPAAVTCHSPAADLSHSMLLNKPLRSPSLCNPSVCPSA